MQSPTSPFNGRFTENHVPIGYHSNCKLSLLVSNLQSRQWIVCRLESPTSPSIFPFPPPSLTLRLLLRLPQSLLPFFNPSFNCIHHYSILDLKLFFETLICTRSTFDPIRIRLLHVFTLYHYFSSIFDFRHCITLIICPGTRPFVFDFIVSLKISILSSPSSWRARNLYSVSGALKACAFSSTWNA
jgi:hypothetical protein